MPEHYLVQVRGKTSWKTLNHSTCTSAWFIFFFHITCPNCWVASEHCHAPFYDPRPPLKQDCCHLLIGAFDLLRHLCCVCSSRQYFISLNPQPLLACRDRSVDLLKQKHLKMHLQPSICSEQVFFCTIGHIQTIRQWWDVCRYYSVFYDMILIQGPAIAHLTQSITEKAATNYLSAFAHLKISTWRTCKCFNTVKFIKQHHAWLKNKNS